MPSYAKQIGDAIVAVIGGLPGAPQLIKLRKDNAILGRESPPAVIVTVESEAKAGRAFEGTIHKEYKVVIGIFRACLADVSSNLDLNPAFILECKQAFDVTTLAGASVVWDIDLVDNPEWEHQPFGQGWEVSRFGLLVKTTEPQN